jgi:pullulanase/glycogen debranching enzyme
VLQQTTTGRSSPLGATVSREGANFSVYSKHATGIELLLFDRTDDARPASVIRIDPATNRTYHYWHVYVADVKVGQIYGYRVSGAPIHRAECALTTASSSWILTDLRSPCRKPTAGRLHESKATTPQAP